MAELAKKASQWYTKKIGFCQEFYKMITKHVKVGEATFTIELRDDADVSVANEIFLLHEYRAAEAVIMSAKNPILDIGAHAGFFTLLARGLNPVVPIVAVEPFSQNLQQLKHHLLLNKVVGVEVVDGAIVGEKRRQKLALTADNHNNYLTDESEDIPSTKIVPLYTLADLHARFGVDSWSLVKCDIEGGEYDIILMSPEDELQRMGAVILEYHADRYNVVRNLETRLRECGYGVQIFPSKFDKAMGFMWAVNKRMKKSPVS